MPIRLTAAMRSAAVAYARRTGEDIDEAARLARLNLLTADGKRKHAKKGSDAPKRKAARIAVTREERAAFRKRGDVTLSRDEDGYYIHSGRQESRRYATPGAIPAKVIRQIEG